jgi:hypothetical protein
LDVVTQVPYGELAPVEQSLVCHVRLGERLDLAAGGEATDEAAMRSWGDGRTCRAVVIRDILCGRLALDPDPHGLRLRGARISGRLDVDNVTTDVNLELTDCFLEEGLTARDAHMAFVGLAGCWLEHPVESPADATRIVCNALDLNRSTILGHAEDGAVCLIGARIGGDIDCYGSRASNDSGPALNADGVQVGHAMSFRDGFTATGSGDLGAVRLSGARICDSLDCAGARMINGSGSALCADGMQVGQAVFLRGGFTAAGSGEEGAVRLIGARIGIQLICVTARLSNDSGPALVAGSLHVDQTIYLDGEFTSSDEYGAVCLNGTHVGGNLKCEGARLANDSGSALYADSLQVDQAIYLRDGFTATGGGAGVAVDLIGARAGGALLVDLGGLKHATDPGRLLAADGLTYASVPKLVSAREWMQVLRHGTGSYAAQPYQQLAAGYRALGDDRQACQILMAQRVDQLARAHPRWSERLWGPDHQGHPRLWLSALAGTAVPHRGDSAVLCPRGRTRLAWRAKANGQHDDTRPTMHSAPADQRRAGPQPTGGHQRSPGGLRSGHGFCQRGRRLADRWGLGASAPSLGIRSAVHRRLHQRRPQDLIDAPRKYTRRRRPGLAAPQMAMPIMALRRRPGHGSCGRRTVTQ